ncbi:GNAT family N-acetyltransferase [Sporosarcina trichiuri]|uniref:GNAT family N-acetyltransferase n=1 Tax=Sporosarcina trichiuri TaxID=3056445 RepID=UPI0025B3E36E|nr:GNAT family N-acetyltransferase [Sporosarcina sp. 0.2-SM1T-5]WJY27147.1 GNAT family N-acetyltransferase [Sporosarcina sp. 0.2-SM1T-5]
MQLYEWTMVEQEQLIHFLTTNTWPFHATRNSGRQLIEKAIREGGYESDEVKTFWLVNDQGEKVGLAKIHDMQDDIPLFDLRIADQYRGRGYGAAALRLITDYVFGLPEWKIRLEGHTRSDNLAMRKTFERAGFVKEGHLRQAWFSPEEDRYYDAITYGITREDYMAGKKTPVVWEDSGGEEQQVPEIPDFPDRFESDRLLIRMPHVEDVSDVNNAVLQSFSSLKEWMDWAQHTPSLAETEKVTRQAVADFITKKDLRFHLFDKETGEFAGSSGLHRIDWSVPKFEVGYWLAEGFTGKGLMTEAAGRITQFAFEELGAKRVEIRCDEQNKKSRAIAERLGFELEAILKNDARAADGTDLRNTVIYAKLSQ